MRLCLIMAIHQVILGILASLGQNQSLEITGSTATITGVSYWIPPDSVGAVSSSPVVQKLQEYAVAVGGLLPLTVVHNDFGDNPFETPSQTFARYRDQDDVWQDEFSKGTCTAHFCQRAVY